MDAGLSDVGAEPFPPRQRVDKLPSAPRGAVRGGPTVDQEDQEFRSGTGAVYEPLN